jgi:protein involved in polysaccharide export with SLBB domain
MRDMRLFLIGERHESDDALTLVGRLSRAAGAGVRAGMKRILLVALLLPALLPAVLTAQPGPSVLPGDRLTVRFAEPVVTHQVMVDERGRVDLPLVGPLQVGTLDAFRLLDSVEVLYARFYRAGGVAVRFERRVSILGDVRRPDLHYVDLSVRLRDAIAIAGGVTESGRPTEVILIRNGTRERITNWRTSEQGNMELLSGDQIVVPKEFWFKLNVIPLMSLVGVVGSIIITLVLR